IEWISDGISLNRETASINYSPLVFSRTYPDSSKESVFMPDHFDGLLVQLEPVSNGDVEFRLHDVALPFPNDSLNTYEESLDIRTEGQLTSISVGLSHQLTRFLTLTCDVSLFESASIEG